MVQRGGRLGRKRRVPRGTYMADVVMTDLQFIKQSAATKEVENIQFRGFVKLELPLSDRRLNSTVQETTAAVWEHVDCQSCANCCRMLHPVFSRAEVQRIATYRNTTVEAIRKRYLTSDATTGRYTTKTLPCPFLEDNLCSIYEVRPAVCEHYPHLQRNFRSRLWQVLDNAAVCPIVYNVLERLKKQFGFVKKEGPVRL